MIGMIRAHQSRNCRVRCAVDQCLLFGDTLKLLSTPKVRLLSRQANWNTRPLCRPPLCPLGYQIAPFVPVFFGAEFLKLELGSGTPASGCTVSDSRLFGI